MSQALKGKWISECKDYTGKPCLKNQTKQTNKKQKGRIEKGDTTTDAEEIQS